MYLRSFDPPGSGRLNANGTNICARPRHIIHRRLMRSDAKSPRGGWVRCRKRLIGCLPSEAWSNPVRCAAFAPPSRSDTIRPARPARPAHLLAFEPFQDPHFGLDTTACLRSNPIIDRNRLTCFPPSARPGKSRWLKSAPPPSAPPKRR